MAETEEHKALKKCAARLFGGKTERRVNGRVDVKAHDVCVEVERSGREDRMKRTIEKLSTGPCVRGVLIVPSTAVEKAERMTKGKDIDVVSIDDFKRLCKKAKRLERL